MGDGWSMRERMLAGEPYLFDESLDADTRRCRLLLQTINVATPDQDAERDAALTELLGSFGEHSNLRPPFRCEYGYQIHVGRRDNTLSVPNAALRTDRDVSSAAQVLGMDPRAVDQMLAQADSAARGAPTTDSSSRRSTLGAADADPKGGAHTMSMPNGSTSAGI